MSLCHTISPLVEGAPPPPKNEQYCIATLLVRWGNLPPKHIHPCAVNTEIACRTYCLNAYCTVVKIGIETLQSFGTLCQCLLGYYLNTRKAHKGQGPQLCLIGTILYPFFVLLDFLSLGPYEPFQFSVLEYMDLGPYEPFQIYTSFEVALFIPGNKHIVVDHSEILVNKITRNHTMRRSYFLFKLVY